MRTFSFLFVLTLFLMSFAVSATAQRKRKPAPKPTPVRVTASPEVSAAKQKVANQLHNVNVFVDKMGPIAVAIENADKDAAARRLKSSEIAANEANKKKVIAAIRSLREGLVALETDFRTKPQLASYLTKIQGISTLCGQSEDSAIAGRFVASKDPLRQVALKLNDTLAVLPGPMPTGAPSTSTRSATSTVPASINAQAPMPSEARTITVSNPSQVQPKETAKREPSMGMTTDEVLQSTWGAPGNKRTSVSPSGKTEVWTYLGNRSIYFFNGKVSNIVK